MRSVEEALDAILATARPTATEWLPLDRCAGRVAAERRLVAAVDVPPFSNSAMDGFAVRADDAPGELRLVGESAAGSAVLPTVGRGTAARIMTGAPLPPGADSVVPLEEAEESGDVVRVPDVRRGSHVRERGLDIASGDAVELPAAPLGPATIAVLASLGLGEVEVRRRPRVAILSTGDELVPPGAPLGPGQIPDSNSFALAAAVEEAGGEAILLERASDDLEEITRILGGGAAGADLLVASGGVSVGRRDHVRAAIEALGSLDFWRIRVQPGKPLAFGSVAGRPVIGLPGNPVSALVTFELFVRPLIRAMLGLEGGGRLRVPVRNLERLGKDRERRAYLRVRVAHEPDGLVARSAGGQGSSQVRPLADANALLVVPEGEAAAAPGATYDALLLGGTL